MPTIAIVGPYRVFFYSADGVEPRHVHIERDEGIAKYWLSPVRLARSRGFGPDSSRHRTARGGARDQLFGGVA